VKPAAPAEAWWDAVPRALALSPHLDDAAFSAGGTLARLAQRGWEVTVATLFTASVPNPAGFALACQTDKGLPPEADYMAIRRVEDAAACAALGARPLFLGLREAPHRGYGNAAALFDAPRDDDDAWRHAMPLLAQALEEARPGLLLVPQAIGGHVDHVMLLRALDALAPSLPIWHWADFPYAAKAATHPARPFEARMAALEERVEPGDVNAKIAACRCYATQLPFQFGGAAAMERAVVAAPECFRLAPVKGYSVIRKD